MKTGILAWSVHHSLKRDFTGTLTVLAEQGYQGVHFLSDFGGYPPDALAELLDGLGLEACAIHARPAELLDGNSLQYEYANALGCPYVTASLSNSEFAAKHREYAETCTRMQAVAADHGITFLYHNHGVEFAEIVGGTAFDRFCSCLDQSARLNLNAMWAQMGGVDPIRFLSQHVHRAPIVHVGGCDAQGRFCDLGTGVFPLREILALIKDQVEWVACDLDNEEERELEGAMRAMESLRRLNAATGGFRE